MNGDLDKALLSLDSAIRLNSTFCQAFGNRGKAHADMGNFHSAIQDYGRAISLSDRQNEYHTSRAIAYIRLGKWDEAFADFMTALKVQPHNAIYRLNACYIFIEFDNDERARDELAKAAASTDPEIQARCALYYQLLGQTDTAESILNRLVENHPDNPDILGRRGEFHDRQNSPDRAIADFNASIALKPTAERLCYRAETYLDMGSLDAAWADCDEAIALDPRWSEAYRLRARILIERNRLEDSIRECDKSLTGKVPNFNSYVIRATVKSKLGHDEEAMSDFKRAADYRGKAWLQLRRGEHFEKLKNLDAALRDYVDAETYFRKRGFVAEAAEASTAIARLKPGVSTHPPNEGKTSPPEWQANPKDFITKASERLRREPDWAQGYIERGLAFQEISQSELAMLDFSAALLLQPNNKEALLHRARILFSLGRSQSTIKDCNHVINLDKNSAPAFFTRGIAHRALGDRASANKDLRKAAELYALSGNEPERKKSLEAIEDS